jgi:type IV secretion system protein VirB2
MNAKTKHLSTIAMFSACALLFLLADVDTAYAAGSGAGLPFEGALSKLQSSITGPVAYAASVIGIAVTGLTLLFGGDLNGFFRSGVTLVFVIGLMVGASNTMSTLFGAGATIGEAADTAAEARE